MTSSVKVTARCGSDTRVMVVTSDKSGIIDRAVLKNGEEKEVAIYDSRSVYAYEFAANLNRRS